MTNPTDCLVVNIEEYDCDSGEKDMNLFILYDIKYDKYILRGKREPTPKIGSVPFSFECSSYLDAYEFIKAVTCKYNYLSITLYNYDNLPADSNDIYYSFLKTHEDREYEIVGFEGLINKHKKTKRRVKNILKLMKYVNNYYA